METTKTPISAWAEEDQPIGKLLIKGRHSLSDAELISILIGSGTKEDNALDISRKVLSTTGNNLNQLGKLSMGELMLHKGVGKGKAATIVAAIELGRRRRVEDAPTRKQISHSKDCFDIMQPILGDLLHEEFWILFLNRANYVIGKKMISSGGMTGIVVDPKMIFIAALEAKATTIILYHNHPSGNSKPSQQDIDLTKKITSAGKLMEIIVLDHLIITRDAYYSFADEGCI